LRQRLFRGEPRSQRGDPPPLPTRQQQLALEKQPLSQPGRPLQRRRKPIDLSYVDPDADDAHGGTLRPCPQDACRPHALSVPAYEATLSTPRRGAFMSL